MKRFLMYAAMGGVGTAVHYVVLLSLVESAAAKPLMASFAGAVSGTIANYLLHARVTFSGHVLSWRAFARFAIGSALSIGINMVVMVLLLPLAVHYLVAQIAATAVALVCNFFYSKQVVFV